MSSSNLAVRMEEHTATDQLCDPPRASLRLVASNDRPARSLRRRISLTNRKFVARDQGLRHFRIR
jgi:hypothetical protein